MGPMQPVLPPPGLQCLVSGRLCSPCLPDFPGLGLVPGKWTSFPFSCILAQCSLQQPLWLPPQPRFSHLEMGSILSCGLMRLSEVPPSLINGGRPSSPLHPPQVPGAVPKLTQVPARMRQPVRPAAPPVTAPAFLAPRQRTALVRLGGSLAGTR